MFASAKNALSDIRAGVRLSRVWMALAQEDIDDQHRRTTLGPVWMMLNYLIYIGTFMLIFGGRAPIPNYLAYISLGMLVFMFLQDVMVRSVSLFQQEKAFIAGTTMPLSVYVLRMAAQNAIRTGYAALGCLAILLMAGTPVTTNWLWSLFGIVEVAAVTIPTIILFATVGAFFPDLQFIITNIVRVGMFLTPIFWVKAAGPTEALSVYNPMSYFIDAVRAPIVAPEMPFKTFVVCGVVILLAWVGAILLLGRYRREIVFLL
jgi:lipopolysaccharide transport system permease protein